MTLPSSLNPSPCPLTWQEAIHRLLTGRTSFVIAHRLSTIRGADIILVVHDGKIVERGTHRELMALGGRCRELYTRQFEEETEEQVLGRQPALL